MQEWKRKKIRIGKGVIFLMDSRKGSFDTYHGQFVLSTEINVIKENGFYRKAFDNEIKHILISPEFIRGKYNYFEYIGEYKKDDFEFVYKKACKLFLKEKSTGNGRTVNILIYKDACYMLDKKYLNRDNRFFKSIESSILGQKYRMGAFKGHKAINQGYGYRANLKQNKILGIRAKKSFATEKIFYGNDFV